MDDDENEQQIGMIVGKLAMLGYRPTSVTIIRKVGDLQIGLTISCEPGAKPPGDTTH